MSTELTTKAPTRYWVVLFCSALLEMTWAIALDESRGFTLLVPTLVFLVAGVASLIGLGYAMRRIPLSVAYAVWTGLGAALTAVIAMLIGSEPASPLKAAFLAGIIGCVVALTLAPEPGQKRS